MLNLPHGFFLKPMDFSENVLSTVVNRIVPFYMLPFLRSTAILFNPVFCYTFIKRRFCTISGKHLTVLYSCILSIVIRLSSCFVNDIIVHRSCAEVTKYMVVF